MKNEEGLRLIRAEITNYKNIEHKIITFDDRRLIVISGANGAGKSSLIQALLSPLMPKIIPAKPIREGEERASVSLTLAGTLHGDRKEYTLDLHFTQANQKGKLYVKNEKGEAITKSVKTVVEGIVGNIGFDIFQFLGATKLKQIQTLKEISGATVEIDKIDIDRKAVYDKRTYTNNRIGELEAIANDHLFTNEEIERFSAAVDLAPLNKELSEVSDKINEWSRIESGVKEFERNLIYITNENIQKRAEVDALKKQIEVLEEQIAANVLKGDEIIAKRDGGRAWLEKNPKPDAVAVTEKIKRANEHNQKCAQVKSLAEKHKELIDLKQKSSELTVALEGFDARKTQVLENSKLPVKGLTFTDEEIFYEGLPFSEDQIPKSKIIAIGAAISMALNPNLRVIVVNDGSLLDRDTLKTLMKIVEKKGYQLIVEQVDQDGGELSINFGESV